MVVGNGLMANQFKNYKDSDEIIIFASGVSNSKETDQNLFYREEQLLKSLPIDKLLVYFSTCSLYDPTLQNSPYVRHKMAMEYVIKYRFKKSLVFRLPNVVGNTNNKNTFFNYFKEGIKNEEKIKVDVLASRYLIDAEDLPILLSGIIERYKDENKIGQKKINVAFDNKTMVIDIVDMMMKLLNKKISVILTHNGCDYEFDKKYFEDYLKSINYKQSENYTYNLLKKYLL